MRTRRKKTKPIRLDDKRAADQTERLRFLGESLAPLGDGVIVVDRDGNYVFANEAGQRLLQQRSGDPRPAAGQAATLTQRCPDGQLVRPEEAVLARPLRGEVAVDLVTVLSAPDGRDVHIKARTSPVRDEQGRIIGAYALLADIGDRARAEEALPDEQALHRSEQRYGLLFETMLQGVVYQDASGGIVAMNPAAERILGRSREEFLGLTSLSVEHDTIREDLTPFPCVEHPAMVALRTGREIRDVVMGVFNPHEQGYRWISVSAVPILGEGEGNAHKVYTLFADITDRKRTEQFREDYLSLVAHDLRGPLTVMIATADMLGRHLVKQGLAREEAMAENIHTSGRRMNTMIGDLVTSARLEAGQLNMHLEPTDLRKLLPDIVARGCSSGDRARVRIESPERVPAVLADLNQIERVIVNLLSNALKYSPPNTPVVIAVAHQDDELLVSISDQGGGILAEDLPHLFGRYYRSRTGKKVEGLGLGLYIARLILEAHRGRVWAESEVGKGSTFCFALPVTGEQMKVRRGRRPPG